MITTEPPKQYDFVKTSKVKLSTAGHQWDLVNMGKTDLESHARSNYRLECNLICNNQINEIYNISRERRGISRNVRCVINSLSHGLSFYDIEINQIPREIRDAIRKLISIMFSYDKNHVIRKWLISWMIVKLFSRDESW